MDYWAAIEPYWEAVDIYAEPDEFIGTFSVVPRGAGLLLAAHWCQSEVCNGGFHQFFTNSTGVLAPEALAGFAALARLDLVLDGRSVLRLPPPASVRGFCGRLRDQSCWAIGQRLT